MLLKRRGGGREEEEAKNKGSTGQREGKDQEV